MSDSIGVDDIMAIIEEMNRSPVPDKRTLARQASLIDTLRAHGWEPGARAGWSEAETAQAYATFCRSGTWAKNLPFAAVTCELLAQNQPDSVRGTMYQVVSNSWLLQDTSDESYDRVQRLLRRYREDGIVPWSWIVDSVRTSIKRSSWSGLEDFAETVRHSYRKNYWASLPDYPQIIVEKRTVAGKVAPVTDEYDVPLHPLGGYSSITFLHDIAEDWQKSGKEIQAYYIGDFDPSGMNLEDKCRETLTRYAKGVAIHWKRLAVLPKHFDEFNIIPLEPKKSDTRYEGFVKAHGERCAEVEAVPANVLRQLVREAIESHIPQESWTRLKNIETAERDTWHDLMDTLSGDAA